MWTSYLGRSLLVALGMGVLSVCEPEVCLAVPCSTGLTVVLSSRPTAPFSIEVLTTGSRQILARYECDGSSPCLEEVTFRRGDEPLGTHILVKVTTVAGSLVTEFRNVDYGAYRRACACPDATVTAEVPG